MCFCEIVFLTSDHCTFQRVSFWMNTPSLCRWVTLRAVLGLGFQQPGRLIPRSGWSHRATSSLCPAECIEQSGLCSLPSIGCLAVWCILFLHRTYQIIQRSVNNDNLSRLHTKSYTLVYQVHRDWLYSSLQLSTAFFLTQSAVSLKVSRSSM